VDTARFVYAVDVQEGMVRRLERRLAGRLDRVAVIQEDMATVNIREEIADVAFLYYSFHEIEDQEAAAARVARAVKTGGIVAIHEPTIEVGGNAMSRTVELFAGQGMTVEFRRDGLFTRFARLRKTSSCECRGACG
jgi:ubiquinone/menaquinone biosynthesis C-methylase UbiE